MPDPICYTNEWQRTAPDRAIYLPTTSGGQDEYADHVHVFDTPGGVPCGAPAAGDSGRPSVSTIGST